MFTLILFLSSILTTTAAAAAANAPPYIPTDYFLINCGSNSTTQSSDGRNWAGDAQSKFLPANAQSISIESTPSSQNSSVTTVPYMTARIFQHSPFTYTFPVSVGPKFLRLYFYPANYSGLHKSDSFFSVTAGDYTLLENFSAFFTVAYLNQAIVMKEFVIEVRDNQRLNITFFPSPNSYAFINGIEIVSIPANYYVRGLDYPIKIAGQITRFFIENNTALEALYRVNVGGNHVPPTNDTGLFRSWVQDDTYFVGYALEFTPHREIPIRYTSETPNYSAPEIVYTTSRTMDNNSSDYDMTWSFPVDSGFFYLLRLYFCEIQMEVTTVNQRVFSIYINYKMAEEEADVIKWSTGNRIPVYRDYVVFVDDEESHISGIKQGLQLSISPYLKSRPEYGNAILNGLEIFKLNRSDGSLTSSPEKGNNKESSRILAVIGSVLGGATVGSIVGFLNFRHRRMAKLYGTSVGKSSYDPITIKSRSTKTSASSLHSGQCRRFSLADIKSFTNNFDENFIIGTGGFGNVYKGHIDNDATAVAIKRLNTLSNQGVREFETEIELLSKLHHLHLVSLIGYCDENGEMVLVYDYMSNGTLRDHLYKTKNPPLSWNQRLQICIGSARGLHYLHTGAKPTIIHRDVKSTNILLDEKFEAKVSDFGLSKVGPSGTSQTHVSTVVKGSFGYLDPEYYKHQQLTEKSDVYSFGVVLFEVLCARPAISLGLPEEQVNLAEWARRSYRKGNLDEIIDPELRGEIAPECLIKFREVAYSCVRKRRIDRPSMNDIVSGLEFALQLQESTDKIEQVVDASEQVADASETTVNFYDPHSLHRNENTTDDDDIFSGLIEEHPSLKVAVEHYQMPVINSSPQSIFSDLMNPTGR